MSAIDGNRKVILNNSTGACNTQVGQQVVSAEKDFSYEDIAAIQDAYFKGNGNLRVHMSDIPGQICWRSLGERENRKLADKISDSCATKVLQGDGAQEKCEAISETIHGMPIAPPAFFSKEFLVNKLEVIVLSALGLFGVGRIAFGYLHAIGGRHLLVNDVRGLLRLTRHPIESVQKFWEEIKKGPPKDPPDAPTGGGNVPAAVSNAKPEPISESEARRMYHGYWKTKDSGVVESDPLGNALLALPLGAFNLARAGAVYGVSRVASSIPRVAPLPASGAKTMANAAEQMILGLMQTSLK